MDNVNQANELLKKAIEESQQKGLLLEETFKDLDKEVVLEIVNYWYNQIPVIFQNEDGEDLEEYVENQLNSFE